MRDDTEVGPLTRVMVTVHDTKKNIRFYVAQVAWCGASGVMWRNFFEGVEVEGSNPRSGTFFLLKKNNHS